MRHLLIEIRCAIADWFVKLPPSVKYLGYHDSIRLLASDVVGRGRWMDGEMEFEWPSPPTISLA